MENKTIYEQLNEEVCNNISILLKTEQEHFLVFQDVLQKFVDYIGYKNPVVLLKLDYQINVVGVVDTNFFKTKMSPLVQSDDGFWYAGFLLEFYKKYDEFAEIKPTDATIVGIKCNNGSCALRLLNGKTIYNAENQLDSFFNGIVKEIKEDFSLDLILKNKKTNKIGF